MNPQDIEIAIAAAGAKIHNKQSATKTLTVVYSCDSISSIMTAGLLKGFIQGTAFQESVKFIEVQGLHVTKMTDEYIWLGIQPTPECAIEELRPKFSTHPHIIITDDTLWQFPQTALMKSLAQLAHDNGLTVKTMTTTDMLQYSSPPEAAIYFGLLLSSFNALLKVYPQIKPEQLLDEVVPISSLQKRCAQFYDKQTPISEIIHTYKLINNILITLGQPGDFIPEEMDIDKLSLHYKTRYDHIARQITNQATTREIKLTKYVYKDRAPFKSNTGVRMPVICTFLSSDFWLARRIISFSHKYYHNTRLVSFGRHQTTNVPQKLVMDMAGQSDHAIIITKS